MTESPYHDGLPGSYDRAPDTSHAAAVSIADFAASIRAKALAVVRDAESTGVIADDVATHLGLNVYQVRSRLSELHTGGKIADSGFRRRGASGRMTAVWCLPQYVDETPPASLTTARGAE